MLKSEYFEEITNKIIAIYQQDNNQIVINRFSIKRKNISYKTKNECCDK
jgi:hypothetical protein